MVWALAGRESASFAAASGARSKTARRVTGILLFPALQPVAEDGSQVLVEPGACMRLRRQDGAVDRVGEERGIQRHRLDVRHLEHLLEVAP